MLIENFFFVGTFGQPNIWEITSPSSYQHPMAPYDVLVDPLSVPKHPTFDVVDDETTNEMPNGENQVSELFNLFLRHLDPLDQ